MNNATTYHSAFKLYPPIEDNSVNLIKAGTKQAKKLIEANIIIWEEVTLAKCYSLDALDLVLRDLMNNNIPFGGKVILLGKH